MAMQWVYARRVVREAAVRTEALLDAVGERLQAFRELKDGRVTIGVAGAAKHFAPRLIDAFMENFLRQSRRV